jgi:hypothetical protein
VVEQQDGCLDEEEARPQHNCGRVDDLDRQ